MVLEWPTGVSCQVNTLLLSPLFPNSPKLLFHSTIHLIRKNDDIFNMQSAKLQFIGMGFLLPDRHTLSLDHFYHSRLYDFSPFLCQSNNMTIKMGDIARPVA